MSDITATLLALDDKRFKAMVDMDFATMGEVYADDLVYVHSSAVVDSKQSYFEAIKNGKYRYQTMRKEDVKVRVYGDAAVITGRATIDIVASGTPKVLRNVFVGVYAQRGGKWQMVHWSSTPIPQPAA